MPRLPRSDVAGQFYHALNRGNARQSIFHKDEDYEAFERIMKEGLEKYPVDLLCYQWMPNHWHMILMPRKDGAMGRGSRYPSKYSTGYLLPEKLSQISPTEPV